MTDTPRRVLLVDDEVELVAHLTHRLTLRGLAAEGATEGDAAVRLVSEQTFDVAVVDLKMPGMDGLEVLRRLKSLQPMLEVIMLTGYGTYDNAFECGRLAAYRFLTKPYEFDKLLEEIDNAYAAKRAAQRAAYQAELQALAEGDDREAALAQLKAKYEQ